MDSEGGLAAAASRVINARNYYKAKYFTELTRWVTLPALLYDPAVRETVIVISAVHRTDS